MRAIIYTTPCVASCFTPCETPPSEAQVKPIPLSKNVVGMAYMILYLDVNDLLCKQNVVQVFYMMLVCHSLIHGRGIPHWRVKSISVMSAPTALTKRWYTK